MASPGVASARRFGRNIVGTIVLSGDALVAITFLHPVLRHRSSNAVYGYLLAGWVLLSGYLLARTLTSAIRQWGVLNDRVAQAFGLRVLVDLAIAAGIVLGLFAVFN